MILVFLSISGCQMEGPIQIEDGIYEINEANEVTIEALSYETWNQQLDYLVNKTREMEFITTQELNLIGYKLLDHTIDKETLPNKDTRMPLYNDPRDINNFVILPLSEIKRTDPETGNRYENGLKKFLLDKYDTSELKNVQLTWRYKDEVFSTVCFVTDRKVVYDDILSRIRLVVITKPASPIAINIPRLKSRDDNENGGEDGPISYYGQTPRIDIHMWTGGTVAFAYCNYWAYGNRINGVNYLDSAECIPYSWAESGYYYADADIKITELIPGTEIDGHVSFAYGCAVGDHYVSILWDDFEHKYIVSSVFPPVDSSIGNVSVTPSMLN